LLEKIKDEWKFKNIIKGYENSCRFFEFDKNNNVWITNSSTGIYKLEIDFVKDTITKITLYNDSIGGLPDKNTNYVFKINDNEIVTTTNKGLYRYNKETDKFETSQQYNQFFSDKKMDLFVQDNDGDIWYQQEATVGYSKGYIAKHKDGTYKKISKPFKKFQNVYNENYTFTEGYTFFNR